MRNIDIKMKLKLIVGLIGVLSLSSFSTLPSSDDTDKKEQENWVIGPFHRPEGVNPVLTPQPTSFYCPMRKEQVKDLRNHPDTLYFQSCCHRERWKDCRALSC